MVWFLKEKHYENPFNSFTASFQHQKSVVVVIIRNTSTLEPPPARPVKLRCCGVSSTSIPVTRHCSRRRFTYAAPGLQPQLSEVSHHSGGLALGFCETTVTSSRSTTSTESTTSTTYQNDPTNPKMRSVDHDQQNSPACSRR